MGVDAKSANINQPVSEPYIDTAAELTGIDPEFDSVTVDPSLDTNVPAATRFQKKGMYEKTDFVENPYAFQQLSKGEKLNASAHEILESKQVNGFLGEELKETHDISDEFADFLNYAQTEFPNDIREGMTQALTNKILPEGERTGRRFYPEQTDIFESLLEGQGFDLEEELFEDVKNEVEAGDYTLGSNNEIYDFAIDDNLYYEKGNVAGIDYEFMAIGEGMGMYGSEIADQYKQGMLEYNPSSSGMYGPIPEY